MKVSRTVNELDNLKYLLNHNSKFKSKIKSLENKLTQKKDDDEGDYNDERKYSGDQFGGNQSRKKSEKLTTRPPLLSSMEFYLINYEDNCNMN